MSKIVQNERRGAARGSAFAWVDRGGKGSPLCFGGRLQATLLLSAGALAFGGGSAAIAAPSYQPPVTNETPIDYRLDLTIDPAKDRFAGHAEIDVRLKEPTRVIHLDGEDLDVTRVEARAGGRTIGGAYRQVDADGHAEVTLDAPLPAGRSVLAFDYTGKIQDGPGGIFHAQVAGQWFVSSEFEATHARRAFPSFDAINYKTPFTVSLRVPHGMTAVSAMPEVSEKQGPEFDRHLFAPSPPLPTYLMSFAAGPFASVSGFVPPNAERRKPLPLRIFAPPAEASKMQFTLTQSARIIGMLEDFLGVAYPYPKVDEIGSPVMKGGMENAGAVVYGDDQLFVEDGAPPRTRQFFGILVTHELAHQWFGDFMTPRWWSDIWLKESFAQWTALTLYPRWLPGVSTAYNYSSAFGDMDPDSLPDSQPLRQPLDEARLKLGYSFIYGKGSQILTMTDAYIGEDRFRAGVREFLLSHANGSASAPDFFAALGRAAGNPAVTESLRSFTDQPGVPLLDIRRDGPAIIVSQHRYAPLGIALKPETWTIPFCYGVGGRRACTMLDKPTARIELASDAAIMPNAGGVGYYRFNLSDADWDKLIGEGDRLSVGEGIALDDSIWAGFRGGYLAPRWLVEALHRLAANPSSDVALDGADRWMEIADLGLIPSEALPSYRAMLASVYGPMLAKVGFDPSGGRSSDGDQSIRRLRSHLVDVLALGARQPELVAALNRATDRFLAGESGALDPALLRTALEVRVRSGGRAAAQAILARAAADDVGSFRRTAVTALGSSDDPDVAAWLLGQFGHTGLRLPDDMDLVQEILEHSATQRPALDWLRSNYARVAAMQIGRGWGPSIAGRLCSAADAAEIERIMRPSAPKDTSAGAVLDETVQQIQTCAALREARSRDIAQALADAR